MTNRALDDLDPRITPAREDLAASWLKERVKADRYIEPARQSIIVPIANIYRSPDSNQVIETQFLFGEPVDVLEVKGDWAWVQSARDSYVGYTAATNIKASKSGDSSPTHRVSNISAFVYPEATIKATPLMSLSYGSLIRVTEEKPDLCKLATGGYIPTSLIASIDFHADEIIAEAFRFLGTPYLWGGKSSQGLDHSSLVQLVLQANNYQCPRDSDLQEKQMGRPIDRDAVQAGDLVFFRGHVGLMVDDSTIIHANDRAMAVSIDDLDEYVHWRSKNGKTPVKMFKRVG
jgi:cell wall-associated NlpC family hydrolase